MSTNRTMSVIEAANALGIARSSAYDAVHRGEIPTLRIGRRLLVPRAALEAMLGEADDRRIDQVPQDA